jgi:hypothetical protein
VLVLVHGEPHAVPRPLEHLVRDRSLRRIEAAVRKHEREISDEQLHLALLWIAGSLVVATLTPAGHTAGRRRLQREPARIPRLAGADGIHR